MADAVRWIHDEMLSPQWAEEGSPPAVFVFDDEWLDEERISLKRIVFVYECLLEMPGVEIRRGDVVEEVRAFARRHGASRVETARSPLSRIKRQAATLEAAWLDEEPFATLPAGVDLKRFSRYWRKAERGVMNADR